MKHEPMTPERAKRIEQLYHAAFEFDRGQPAFLAEACAGDEALLREVVSALARLCLREPLATAAKPNRDALKQEKG
jgi:hypothetical protein